MKKLIETMLKAIKCMVLNVLLISILIFIPNVRSLEAVDWPMFHHDLNHTGYSTSPAPDTNNLLWDYATGNDVLFSSPAVVDGRVYVGSWDNKVYCFNASTGAWIWDYTTGGRVSSSPAVVDGKVYVGTQDNNKIYCLNATTGAWIWDYTTGDGVSSSPAVVDGKVYVGSVDSKIYCLNATTGAWIWDYTTGNGVVSSPAVVDGKVYVGSIDSKIYCLNATTGAWIWDYTTDHWVYSSSPAVADGKVYVGSRDSKVYCLNATTGAWIWDYTTGGRVYSSPAVADGKVYVGSQDNKVYCLNATTGAWIWDYTTDDLVDSSPAVADGKVYVGSRDNKVYAFGAPPYNVTIDAYCNTIGEEVSVSIDMDGFPTGYTTPHTFVDLTGSHTFTVPDTDIEEHDPSHQFKQWSSSETNTTLTITENGTYTAYYEATAPIPAPTLSEWGMIITITAMMITGLMILRKRRIV